MTPSFDITNPIASIYTITVIAINSVTDNQATPVTITYSYKVGSSVSDLLPPINPRVTGTAALLVTSSVVSVSWDYNTANDSVVDKIFDYIIEVYDEVPATLLGTFSTTPNGSNGGSFEASYANIYDIFADLPRKFTLRIYSRDTNGDRSLTYLEFTLENPVPAAISFSLTPLTKGVQVTITPSTDTDGVGYNIYTSLTSGGTRTLVYTGTATTVIIPCLENPPVLKYYTIDAFDLLGNTGLVTSVEHSATALDLFTIPGISADYVQFNTSYSGTPAVGKMFWDSTNGTVQLGMEGGNVNLQLGQETLVRVVNKTSPLIDLLGANYQAVIITGATGQRLSVKLAQADSDTNSATTIGLVTETIPQNQEGFITSNGLVHDINTTGSLQSETWADGDILYLSPHIAGAITNVKPVAPDHSIVVGYVEYAHAIHGKIFVKVDNGYELEELHNVLITTPTTGDVLKYNGTVWTNASNPLSYTAENISNKVTAWSSPTDVQYPSAKLVSDSLALKLDASAYHLYYRGKFTTLSALTTAIPLGIPGEYAQVDVGAGDNVVNYNWDDEEGWVIGSSGSGATNTDALPEGSTNLYFTESRVRSTLLTGFSALAGTIGATDSILVAFNKLVGNIAAIIRNDISVTQTSHGFVIGDAVYFNGTNYVKAKADLSSTLGLFIVTTVTSSSIFSIANTGYVGGLSGLTAGQYYYVSSTTAGSLTVTEPTTIGHYSNPIFFALSPTSGYILSMRPSLIAASFNLYAWLFNGAASVGSYVGWNDIVIDIIVKGSGANDPTWTAFRNGIYTYAFSVTLMKEVWGVLHIEHDYKPGGQVLLHVHWSTAGTDTGTCRWGVEYTIAKGHGQEAFPATATTYLEAAANGTPYTHYVTEMSVSLPVASVEPDSLILIRTFRDATHVNDTLTDVAYLLKMDVHYETDRFATKNRNVSTGSFYV